jgi:hypothetical protein
VVVVDGVVDVFGLKIGRCNWPDDDDDDEDEEAQDSSTLLLLLLLLLELFSSLSNGSMEQIGGGGDLEFINSPFTVNSILLDIYMK